MENNIIQNKSHTFALHVITLYQFLMKEKREYVLSKQFLRSGTSIGANVEEALGGQSKRDFIAKLSIAYKEARETHYWIRLLTDSKIMNQNESQGMLNECSELIKILSKILLTSKACAL